MKLFKLITALCPKGRKGKSKGRSKGKRRGGVMCGPGGRSTRGGKRR